jgi:hypothetical protein
MDTSMDPSALQAELELLRQDNAALLEAVSMMCLPVEHVLYMGLQSDHKSKAVVLLSAAD